MDNNIKKHYEFVEKLLNMTNEERKNIINSKKKINENNLSEKFSPIQLSCSFDEFAQKWGGAISFDEAQERLDKKIGKRQNGIQDIR